MIFYYTYIKIRPTYISLRLTQIDKVTMKKQNKQKIERSTSRVIPTNGRNKKINLHCIANKQNCQKLLGTALINIYDICGNKIQARALLHSCSMTSLVTKNLARKLDLEGVKAKIVVGGFNNANSTASEYVEATFSTVHDNYSKKRPFLLIEKITEHVPLYSYSKSEIKLPKIGIM